MGVLQGCKPRPEVLEGDLSDAIFAADFGDLIAGKSPDVYGKPATFFRNAHPAAALKKIAGGVFQTLATDGPGATIRLSTGFGGANVYRWLPALRRSMVSVEWSSDGSDLKA